MLCHICSFLCVCFCTSDVGVDSDLYDLGPPYVRPGRGIKANLNLVLCESKDCRAETLFAASVLHYFCLSCASVERAGPRLASPVVATAALGSFFSSVSWSLLCFVEAEKWTKRAPVLLSAAPPDEYAYL